MNFIKAESVKNKLEKIDDKKVEKFISKFNSALLCSDGGCSLNNSLNKIPTLNPAEFNYAVGLALQQGWVLTKFDDNYNSITYKMGKK